MVINKVLSWSIWEQEWDMVLFDWKCEIIHTEQKLYKFISIFAVGLESER